MTKREIYEVLSRDDWRKIEFFDHRWWKMPLEDRVLFHLHDQIKNGTFHPDNWRLRNVKDEQE